MPPATALSCSLLRPEIAHIEFRTSGEFDGWSPASIPSELGHLLDELTVRGNLVGLIVALPNGNNAFGAEAYLSPFTSMMGSSPHEILTRSQSSQQVLARLSECPFITAAAIDGFCLGWAAELACWCDIRVATPDAATSIGFPEVEHGLIPAWGGTVRLPRLIGLGNALAMIAEGKCLNARQARERGLIDAIAPREGLFDAMVEIIQATRTAGDHLDRRSRRRQPLSADEVRAAQGVHVAGNPPALETPEASTVARQLLFAAVCCDSVEAGRQESQAVSQLVGSPDQRGWQNAVELQRRNQRDGGTGAANVQARTVRSVGVIGAGIMGSGIATANLDVQIPVVMTDASAKALRHGIQTVLEQEFCLPETEAAVSPDALLTGSEQEGDVAACDLVIETVVENMEVKRRIFDRLEPILASDTILASNTSTLPITQLAERLARPELFCGLHFLNPVRDRRLVEVIRGPKSSESTIATVVAYVKRLGKMPIVVNDGPGFLINRLLCGYLNEAQELLCQGVPMADIDRAAESFGMRSGPIQLYDLIGIDTAFYAGRSMWDAFPDRIGLLPVIPAMVKRSRLGRKTGRGFYRYDTPDGPPIPDPDTEAIINGYVRHKVEVDQATITTRLFLAMLLEATRVLESDIVSDPRDVDTGVVYGLGFPRSRGGIMFWGDTLGAAKILEMIRPLEALGPRFQATQRLIDMAGDGRKFYDVAPTWG